MVQTVRTVVIEGEPDSIEILQKLIDDFKAEEEGPPPDFVYKYDRLKMRAPALHFMSMSIFEAADYDPIFVIETNFDGLDGPIWAQLEAAIPSLRAMLRCCKRPAGPLGDVYDAISYRDSIFPLAPYLEAHMVKPRIFHLGNRGLDRTRILRESELFVACQDELMNAETRNPNPYRPATASEIHQRLRAALRPKFSWLDEPASPRIPKLENLTDRLRLIGLVLAVLLCLSIPGLLLALVSHSWVAIAISLAAAAMAARAIGDLGDLRQLIPKSASPGGKLKATIAGICGLTLYVLVFSFIGAAILALLTPVTFLGALKANFIEMLKAALLVLAVGLFSVLAILWWLRRLERRDPSQDEPPINDKLMREILKSEDHIVQNHMGSLVLVKPGALRAVLIRIGLVGLGLLLRVTARDGYLGDMRTIHFAHWALVSNESRLLFLSNFDGSWESYLDDFIEKAHSGLTLAWANGVGFPPARFLLLEGATHGRLFKAWARHSMTVSRFWFSAYTEYSVNQIERNAAVANGLRRVRFDNAEDAKTWARNL